MADTLSWLQSIAGPSGGGFLSTHPATGDRIQALRSGGLVETAGRDPLPLRKEETKMMRMTTMREKLAVLGLALSVAGCATAQGAPPQQSAVAVYPQRGQSTDQQSRDSQECAVWAQQQTAYNPTTSTATGVGVGAAIGLSEVRRLAPPSAPSRATRARARRSALSRARSGEGAVGGTTQYSKSKDGYEKSYAACMGGRGYSVAG